MPNDPQNFTEARERLEEIVSQVRSKDVSLEKSLDLFDEAIRLGNSCFELIDRIDPSETVEPVEDAGEDEEQESDSAPIEPSEDDAETSDQEDAEL